MLDYFQARALLGRDEQLVMQSVRAYVDGELMPQIADWWDQRSPAGARGDARLRQLRDCSAPPCRRSTAAPGSATALTAR